MLAPFALVWSALYSFTKRITPLCHFFLGSVLGLAPLAGWLAVTPLLTLPAVLLGIGVVFWVGGFDILYACQDADLDDYCVIYVAYRSTHALRVVVEVVIHFLSTCAESVSHSREIGRASCRERV